MKSVRSSSQNKGVISGKFRCDASTTLQQENRNNSRNHPIKTSHTDLPIQTQLMTDGQNKTRLNKSKVIKQKFKKLRLSVNTTGLKIEDSAQILSGFTSPQITGRDSSNLLEGNLASTQDLIKNIKHVIRKRRTQTTVNSLLHSPTSSFCNLNSTKVEQNNEILSSFKSEEPKSPALKSKNPQLGKSTLGIEHLTPELMAKIVKYYILPMFDSKPVNCKPKSTQVHEELKLSVRLQENLENISKELQNLRENKQMVENILKNHDVEIKWYKKQLVKKCQAIMNLKQQKNQFEMQKERYRRLVNQQEFELDNFYQYTQCVSHSSIKNAEKARHSMAQLDLIQNQDFKRQQELVIFRVNQQVTDEQLRVLFSSIQSIANSSRGDMTKQQLDFLQEKFDQISYEFDQTRVDLAQVTEERDQLRDMLQEKVQIIEKQKIENQATTMQYKTKLRELDLTFRKKERVFEQNIQQMIRQEQTLSNMQEENQKLLIRIKKLRLRKRTNDTSTPCANCKQVFKANENYNWSCRTHQSQWSGEMWWCCGKNSKQALGCKFAKHEVLKDEDDNEEENKGEKFVHLLRCTCCKEHGHLIDQCPRDPNPKTTSNIDSEFYRLLTNKENKRVFSDSHVQTAHMLKKCVIMQFKNLKKEQLVNSSFKRGAMQFEDFNYTVYNPHILVENGDEIDDKPFEFVAQNMKQISTLPQYDYNSLIIQKVEKQDSTEGTVNELQSDQDELHAGYLQKIRKTVSQQNLYSVYAGSQYSDSDSSIDENAQIIYFNNQSIQNIKQKQNEDVFYKICQMKSEVQSDDQKQKNKLNIMDWLPDTKEKTQQEQVKKKVKRRRMIVRQSNDLDQSNFDDMKSEYNFSEAESFMTERLETSKAENNQSPDGKIKFTEFEVVKESLNEESMSRISSENPNSYRKLDPSSKLSSDSLNSSKRSQKPKISKAQSQINVFGIEKI